MFGSNNIGQQSSNSVQSYTDLNALNDVKKLGREQNPEAILEVARQFESYFISQMMKEMRASVDVIGEGNFQNSSEMQFHQQMFDQQMSLQLSKSGGYGLAQTLARQLMEQYNLEWQDPAPNSNPNANGETQIARTGPINYRYPAHQDNAPEPINRDNFIQVLSDLAEKAANKLGVDKRVLIAQAALETGWGEHITKDGSSNSFNLFNIKSDQRWQGNSINITTIEFHQGVAEKQLANFRAYSSYEESFEDYVDFVQNNPRYQAALASASDSQEYIKKLHEAGYATDPNYSEKIIAILNQPEIKEIE